MTSNTAPAHPHATGVAVYPALFFCCVLATQKIAISVHLVVGPSVTLYFFGVNVNVPLTSSMAPAHPHATGVAVYPALFFFFATFWIRNDAGKTVCLLAQ